MKKIFTIIVCFFFCIMMVEAKVCKIASGDGTHIGDEIQCDSEYFYVISNDGEKVKMLAKYNLLVGRTFYKIEFDTVITSYSEAKTYWTENYADEYFARYSWIRDSNSNYIGAYAYDVIETDKVLQDSTAIGAHGDESGNPDFPEVGIVSSSWVQNEYIDSYTGDKRFLDFDYSVTETGDNSVQSYLDGYTTSLNEMNINIEEISTLSLSELNEIVYKLTGNEIPLEEWYLDAEKKYDDLFGTTFYVLGSIKDKLNSKYEWLWGTTYWLRTLSINDSGNISQYFVDTLGDLCTGDYCFYSIGAGIRPVVTIAADEITYIIETKTDGNGTLTSSKQEADSGEEIEFVVTPNEGYEVEKIKVTDAHGNEIVFNDNKFTMPSANVLIEATFVTHDNPNTKTFVGSVIVILSGISCALVYLNRKKLINLK